MKKAFSVSFIIVFLLGSTELHEMLKIPFLWDHYRLHIQEEKDQSFATFLILHYASGQEHEHGQNEHEKLPLKTKDCFKYGPTFVALNYVTDSCVHEDFIPLKGIILFENIFLSNLNRGSIWQPPQIS
jgi:hypothetical protein